MIEEHALVVGCVNEVATLEIERRTACGLCGQKRGCGNATWGKLLGHKTHAFTAVNLIGANVGDSVVVGINERSILGVTFFLYVVPLLGLLAGAVLADVFLKNEFYVLLSAVAGLVLAFICVKRYLNGDTEKGNVSSNRYQAVILRHADEVMDSENITSARCERSKISNLNEVKE